MANVGYATLDVIPSLKGFRSKLESGTSADLTAAGRTGGKKYGETAGKQAGASFKNRFSEGIKGIAAPLAGVFAGAAIVNTFKDAIEGASDLAESGTKIQAIFGDASTTVQGFAGDAAASLGQTRVQALDAASTFGTFGKAAGLAGNDLSGFSTELVTLATDMASFYNTDVQTAIDAIGSGLRGEAEPLRQFGVLLDDATLRQEALSQGLIQTTKQALTPQQKVLAAHAVILKQTSDAQGDFERTSGGLANQQRILAAQWAEMKTQLGSKLLPAAVGVAHAFNDDVLPAIQSAGGAVGDATRAFGSLPGPVKAAAGAFVLLRVASATGLTAAVASGAASIGSAMVGLRIRTLLAADAFKTARAGTLTFAGNTGKFVAPVGRMSASLAGLRAAAIGAGAGIKAGIGSATALLGGPFGVALLAATAGVTYFWQENQKAKQFVDDLTTSLDKQTGALTANSKEVVLNQLASKGWVEYADKLGISLDLVRKAALGNGDALAEVQRQVDAQSGSKLNPFNSDNWTDDSDQFVQALKDSGAAIDEAKTKQDQNNRFLGAGAQATRDNAAANTAAAGTFSSMAEKIDAAKAAIQGLISAEDKRRLAAVQAKRDEIALIQTKQAAYKEAREGKRTLDDTTKAGQANMSSLLDLADQWNNSSAKVRNARGAYKDIRQSFIDVAEKMGATKQKAKELADKYLLLPKRKKTEITTPGMEKALADLKRLQERVKSASSLAVYVNTKQANDPRLKGFASGGKVGGTGYGDKQLILADSREWVINPSAVNYYGDGLMDAINKMRLPRYAQGGPVTSQPASITRGGSTFNVTVVADDPWKWKRDMEHMQRTEAIGAVSFRGVS